MTTIELIRSKILTDFPSGSSINFRDSKFFLIGDDATHILVMDSEYNTHVSERLFEYPEKRIPKPTKPDLEAATFMTRDNKEYLMLIGSASVAEREKIFLIPYENSHLDVPHFRVYSSNVFAGQLKKAGIKEVNLEGATIVKGSLLMGNRGNRKNPVNHLIVVDDHAFPAEPSIPHFRILLLDTGNGPFFGLSDLCYFEEKDILFMSFSTEYTDNAYDDGAVGDCYIGWINNAGDKIRHPDIKADHIINLSQADKEFRNQKIEGLCVESYQDNQVTLHLVSDDDLGKTRLFKVRMVVST